jgi:hypothetical protein
MSKQTTPTQMFIDELQRIIDMPQEEFDKWLAELDRTPLDPDGLGAQLMELGFFDRLGEEEK